MNTFCRDCVDYLSFGSEWASVDDYELYVQLLVEESPEYQSHLQEGLRQGKSFPLARMDAICQIMEKQGRNREEIKSFLSEPNHILGLEYMKSLRRLQSDIVPVTVGRRGAGYHEEKIIEGFPSATSLRLECGREISREALIKTSMKHFETFYEKYEASGDFSLLKGEYEKRLVNRNSQVRVLDPQEPFEGIAKGIDDLGDLLVLCEDGQLKSVCSGEVSVRGLYGYV